MFHFKVLINKLLLAIRNLWLGVFPTRLLVNRYISDPLSVVSFHGKFGGKQSASSLRFNFENKIEIGKGEKWLRNLDFIVSDRLRETAVEIEPKRFWMAFATSTSLASSFSPTKLNKILWNCGLPRSGWHWRRIVLKRMVWGPPCPVLNLLTTPTLRDLCRGRTPGNRRLSKLLLKGQKSSRNGIGRIGSF